MANDGKGYEAFVASLQQAIIASENLIGLQTVIIEQNKKIKDNCGIYREFDLYWEYEFGGITYKTVIECKDYNSKISVEKIDALIGKLRDLPDLKPVFATKTGYQSGAKKKAEANKIELLIVREQVDSDWQLSDGTPLIKKVRINMCFVSDATITSFKPKIDYEWVKLNTDFKPGEISLKLPDNEIFIEDLEKEERYSLSDLRKTFEVDSEEEYGEHHISTPFTNAFLCFNDVRLKLLGIDLTYYLPRPHVNPMLIDFSKELVGVVEYLDKSSKTAIFKDKVIKGWADCERN